MSEYGDTTLMSLEQLLDMHIEARRKSLQHYVDMRKKIDDDDSDPLHNTNFAKDWISDISSAVHALEMLRLRASPDHFEF